jgi:hypothetical protein
VLKGPWYEYTANRTIKNILRNLKEWGPGNEVNYTVNDITIVSDFLKEGVEGQLQSVAKSQRRTTVPEKQKPLKTFVGWFKINDDL